MNRGYLSHTDPIFKELDFLKFNDLFDYNCCIFMHSLVKKYTPESFKDMFKNSISERTNNLTTDRYRNKFLSQFPSYYLPLKWNSLSLDLKNQDSRTIFKKAIYSNFVLRYNQRIKKCKNSRCSDCN